VSDLKEMGLVVGEWAKVGDVVTGLVYWYSIFT
jgi:hypothetical protein